MINFKKIELTDISVLKAYFSAYPSRQCDRSAGATAMWRDYFENSFAVIDGTIIFSSRFKDEVCFSFPIGKNVSGAVDALEIHCKELEIPLVFCSVNKSELPVLKERFGKITADFIINISTFGNKIAIFWKLALKFIFPNFVKRIVRRMRHLNHF